MFVFVIILNLEFLSLSWVGMKPFTFDLVTWWPGDRLLLTDAFRSASAEPEVGQKLDLLESIVGLVVTQETPTMHCGVSVVSVVDLCGQEPSHPVRVRSPLKLLAEVGRGAGGNQNRPTEREVWCGRLAGGNSHVGEHLGATWTDEKHATFNKCRWSLLGVSMPQTAAANLRLFDNASQMIGRHEKKTCVCACVG